MPHLSNGNQSVYVYRNNTEDENDPTNTLSGSNVELLNVQVVGT